MDEPISSIFNIQDWETTSIKQQLARIKAKPLSNRIISGTYAASNFQPVTLYA
jgi:hypothetical protein